jgi:hypothetical protein
MARIIGSDGLNMNQANGNAYMRLYSRGKNDVGPYMRFTFSTVSTPIHVWIKTYMAFTQTNGSFDFNSSVTMWGSIYCDSSGNILTATSGTWLSGSNIDRNFSTSNRIADLWIQSSTNGGWPGKASICNEIFCDRWDYLTISNL